MTAAFDRDDDEAFFVAQVFRGTDMQTIEGSPALSFSQSDFGKVLKGAGIAAAGAIAAYVLQASGGWDFGPWTFVVVPLLSTAANALLKWLTNTTEIVRKEVAVLLFAAMLLCGSTASAADVTRAIGTRTYTLHSPPKLTTPSPLLLCFHALSQSPDGIARMTGFNAIADRDKFHVAYPAGLNRSWNAGTCCNGNTADDVGFAAAVVADASKIASVDPRRVYATGMSNGAMLAHRLGIERPDLFAAICPVAGSIQTAAPTRPLPVLIQHGTRDLLVPLADARAAETAWKRTGAAVEFVAYSGVGHQWPAGASERVAAFCKLTSARVVPASFRANEFTVTVVSMKGCKPCASLKQALATSEHLKPYAAKIVDRDEARELVRSLGIKSFPTLLVQTHDAKLVYRRSGYDGNAKKLADELASAIKRYQPIQRRALPSRKA